MANKTYNMGRVVGWSSYEEFIRETRLDPSTISPQVYSTLVTYGVSRIVTLFPEDWVQRSEGGTFITQTIRVPGATWGAVPVLGVDYDSYITEFYAGGDGIYSDAKPEEAFKKEALDKAVGNIFTCYISDGSGKRINSAADINQGYLTFVAYPDILDFMSSIDSQLGLRLIVRGLSLVDLNIEDLYFGPQGLLFAGNGLVEDCYHETKDINNLCLNASNAIWMNPSGASASSNLADFRTLVNMPSGDALISSFGYINQDLVEGIGLYQNLGRYGLTYDEYQLLAAEPVSSRVLNINTTQVDAIPVANRNDYFYLIFGDATYDSYPDSSHLITAIPVRKSDGYTNFGDYSAWSTKFKKALDLTRTYGNTDETTVLYLYDKITAWYLGSYWAAARIPATAELPCSLTYSGNNSLGTHMIISTPVEDKDGVEPVMPTRLACYRVADATYKKGYQYALAGQSAAPTNGLYLCTKDDIHDGTGYSLLNRQGAYLNLSVAIPDFWGDKDYVEVDTSLFTSVSVSNGNLIIDGNYVFPGEILYIHAASGNYPDRLFYVWMTVDSGSPKLIISRQGVPRLSLDASASIDDSASGTWSTIYKIARSDWDTMLAKTVDVYSSDSAYTSETFANTDTNLGALYVITIDASATPLVSAGKSYTYTILDISATTVTLGLMQLWLDNPLLSETVGYPGYYNAIIPNYHQSLPDSDGSYYYDIKSALFGLTAAQMFADFGLDIADYVHEDYQQLNLGAFLQECVTRTDMGVPKSNQTLKSTGVSTQLYFYSVADFNWVDLTQVFPEPSENNPINASLQLSAQTSARNFFDTAYYTAKARSGSTWSTISINNTEYPIWATLSKSRFGKQTISLSLIDDNQSLLNLSGRQGVLVPEQNKLTWLTLLIALSTGHAVDLLSGMIIKQNSANQTYIEIPDGSGVMRVYFTSTAPVDARTGDLWIGG